MRQDGRIPPIFLDRFKEIGAWLDVNGEAIYGSRVWAAALPAGSEGAQTGGFEGAGNATYYTTGTTTSGCQHGQHAGYTHDAESCKAVDATGERAAACFVLNSFLDQGTGVAILPRRAEDGYWNSD